MLILLYLGNEAVSEKQVNGFVSSKRTQLSDMLCFVSTPSVGFLYSIGGSFHLVSTYHYAIVVTQVLLLFAYLLCFLHFECFETVGLATRRAAIPIQTVTEEFSWENLRVA